MKTNLNKLFFLLAVFLSCISARAQISIYMDGALVTGETVIAADTTVEHVFTASLPAINFTSMHWTVSGGLKVVNQNGAQLVVKCMPGENYSTRYSRYAKALVSFQAGFRDDEIPEDAKTACGRI